MDFIYAKAKVIVNQGEIKSIDIIKHKNDSGKEAEKVVNRVIKEQKIDVDTISGATNSSKVIKKAIEKPILKK